MRANTAKKSKHQLGFTLIEVLMVMSIIVVLAGLGLASFNYVQRTKKEKTANLQIAEMSTAIANMQLSEPLLAGDGTPGSSLVLYQMLSGDRNSDGQLDPDVEAYVQGMAGQGPGGSYNVSAQFEILDPYGSPYRYQFPGQRNPPNEADVWSIGPDKRENTDDDIKNW